jgi:hypothetical protein
MPAESTGRHLRMPADPGRLELAERRDALVERLTGQLATLEEELEQAKGVREEAEAAQSALSEAHGEIDRLTARLASARSELEAVLAARHKEAEERRELKAALSAAQEGAPVVAEGGDLDRVLRARQREADEGELMAIAARAFNRSPHLQRVRELTTRHGRPKITLGVGGIDLPRRVFIAFAFGGESRTFIVSLDLVARTASVARTSSDEHRTAAVRPGRWSPDVGVELPD